jgi:hypothetical protein
MNNSNHKKTDFPITAFADDLITLPASGHFPPLNMPVRLTRTLWRALADSDEFHPDDEIVDDLCFYLAFALVEMVGFDRISTPAAESLLVPVAFASGRTVMRVTIQQNPGTLTLSLPHEQF